MIFFRSFVCLRNESPSVRTHCAALSVCVRHVTRVFVYQLWLPKSFLVGYRIITGFVLPWCLGSLKTFPGISCVCVCVGPCRCWILSTFEDKKNVEMHSIKSLTSLLDWAPIQLGLSQTDRQTGWIAMNFYFTVQFRFSAYAYMGARPEAMDFV
jgi:hypothetical protein